MKSNIDIYDSPGGTDSDPCFEIDNFLEGIDSDPCFEIDNFPEGTDSDPCFDICGSNEGTDSEPCFNLCNEKEEASVLHDQDNPMKHSFDPGGHIISSEQNCEQPIINSYGTNITLNLAQNENITHEMYRDCNFCFHNGTSWDETLNKVMFYDGKKISMKKKIKIYKLVLKKLEGNKQHHFEKLTREDIRNLDLLNKKLMEVFFYIKEFVQTGDKDFMQLIMNIKSKGANK